MPDPQTQQPWDDPLSIPGMLKRILEAAPIDNEVRRNAWLAFEDAADVTDLSQRLVPLNLPAPTVKGLLGLKKSSVPTVDEVDAAARQQGIPAQTLGRGVMSALQQVNPIEIGKGLYRTMTEPGQVAREVGAQQLGQLQQAHQALQEGNVEAIGPHLGAAALPVVGPAAAQIGEQIASGDVAGGVGSAVGLIAPYAAGTAVRAGARMVPNAVAAPMERAAAGIVSRNIAPKIGANRVRFGNLAEKQAPGLLERGEAGAWSRGGIHRTVETKLAEAEAGLDAAANARNPRLVYHTRPIITALQKKLREITAETVRHGRVVAGQDVVPAPNEARAAIIRNAIDEIQRLGPVARYESLRRIREAYDGPAKAIYSPAVTSDYLKAQGGKYGASDVTGVLRDYLATFDKNTAQANARYHIYRTLNDVLEAAKETDRIRPRVGRRIAAIFGGAASGGAASGNAFGAILGSGLMLGVDAALANGITPTLKYAQMLQNLATAIRGGDIGKARSIWFTVRREYVPSALVQVGQASEKER